MILNGSKHNSGVFISLNSARFKSAQKQPEMLPSPAVLSQMFHPPLVASDYTFYASLYNDSNSTIIIDPDVVALENINIRYAKINILPLI